MALLHIFDSSDPRIVQTAGVRGVLDRLAIADGNDLVPALDRLVSAGSRFSRILFETHGSPGRIYFGDKYISADWWRNVKDRNYTNLTTANARVYFNGCNVAEGSEGWAFLEAVVPILLTPGGGEVFGQTSLGFGNPFNGHVIHLWGSTRTLYVDRNGRILEHFEQ